MRLATHPFQSQLLTQFIASGLGAPSVQQGAFPSSEAPYSFSILGVRVRIASADPSIRALVHANFGRLVAAAEGIRVELEYSVGTLETPGLYVLRRPGQPPLEGIPAGDLLFHLEKDVTVELQKRRPDLYFLHSAALEWNGKACLLAAEAGSGKSTTTWALLHHGFRYLSDELSPVAPDTLRVFPYPHALCLKQPPPDYPLPAETMDLGRTLHVPVRSLPSEVIKEPLPLGAVFLVKYRPDLDAPELRAIGSAEASARLYLTALNALSHPNRGLDAVVRIAEHVPCFAIHSADLPATCALIRSALSD